MNHNTEPPGNVRRHRFRLDTGLDALEEWSSTANQSEKNAVYKALFAVVDGTVFRTYRVVDDWQKLSEFLVIVKDNLSIKLRIHSFDSYGIVYIGPPKCAPGVGIENLDTGLAA